MTMVDPLMDLLAGQLADAEAGWSVGTFGAIAEFTRESGEEIDLSVSSVRIHAVTDRGGIRIVSYPDLRLIASETPMTESWSHRVALCLPQSDCAMNERTVLTELGPDRESLLNRDRSAILFDLGLGALQIDACIRVGDADVVAALRRRSGRSVFAPDSDAMRIILVANPHRVFISRIGRAEVFQPIPPPGGRSPDGPHTHVLPKLLAHRRTHAATEPLPEGWVPCAHLYPAHPLRDQFGRKRTFRPDYHAAFAAVLERYGLPELMAVKSAVIEAVAKGQGPETVTFPSDRMARAAVRVALRQLAAVEHAPALAAWLAAYERRDPIETEDPMEALH